MRPSSWGCCTALLALCVVSACGPGSEEDALGSEQAAATAVSQTVTPAPYPRPGAPVPSYAATPDPRPIPAQGTVVVLWDPGAPASAPEQLAARQVLSALGIPSRTAATPSELAGQEVAIVTGDLSGLKKSQASALGVAVASGTSMLVFSGNAPALYTLAGLVTGQSVNTRRQLSFTDVRDATTDTLRGMGVMPMQLVGPTKHVTTRGYTTAGDGLTEVLAQFEDGSAALVRRRSLYLFGVKASYYLNLLAGEQHGLDESWTDVPVAEGDLVPLVVRGFYASHASAPRLRSTAPGGHRSAVILTHDCDSRYSATYVRQFLAVEEAHGVRATYFVPTSTRTEEREVGITYNLELLGVLRSALASGHDVSSHSFAHLRDFGSLPWQIGGESAASYEPATVKGVSTGASIFGELAVSRWLLEADLPITVQAFRPGHLAFPETYYQSLTAVGYLRSSGQAVGFVHSNFPFRGIRKLGEGDYQVSPVIEYPLGISDHGLDATTVQSKVASWLSVVDQNTISGAPTVLLLHPTTRPGKVEALHAFLDALMTRDVWVGDLKDFADFYEAQGF